MTARGRNSFWPEVLLVLRRCALRHWRLALGQQVVLLLILAMGTAVYLAMRLANGAALHGFERFTESITQQADWTVQGRAGPLPQGALAQMRAALGNRPAILLPVVESNVAPAVKEVGITIGSRPVWRLVGMDLVALQNLRSLAAPETSWPTVSDAPAAEKGVLPVYAGEAMARRYGRHAGELIQVIVNERVASMRLGALLPSAPDMPQAPDNLLLMDLPDAQSFLRKEGWLDRVEVLLEPGPAFPHLREESGQALRAVAGDQWLVQAHEDRRELADTMTEAFRLNLTILSLLALLVGCYLIFQALDGVVLRRRAEIGILKTLGMTDAVIQTAFLVEAACLGTVGGILGVGLGWLGAQASVGGVSRTVNALYGATQARSATLHGDDVALGLGIALLTSLVAAWLPARNAARTPPAWVLGHHTAPFQGRRLWRTEWLGWALLLVAALVAQCGPVQRAGGVRLPLAGYIAALFWIVGAGLAAGALLRWTAHRLGWSGLRRVSLRVALSYLRWPSVRHRFAVAALASAVAMTAGMAIMVASFDTTMRNWIERSMKADLYLASAGAQSASSDDMISPEAVAKLQADPEVAEVAATQSRNVRLPEGVVRVMGVDGAFAQGHDLFAWVEKPKDNWWRRVDQEDMPVLINESYSERYHRHRGDILELPTQEGTKRVRVVGVYADYGNERGSITLEGKIFAQWFQSDMLWRVAVMLKPGADAEMVRSRWQAAFPGLSIFSNSHLRSEALRIFRQTFSVTYAVEVIGVSVAVGGLCLALVSLFLERRADLLTLQALGMTRRQMAWAGACEGAGVAWAGTAQGLLAGVWLGWLLIARINKQCFGWTLTYHFPWAQILFLGVAVIGSGALVAALVGRWGATLPAEQEE